MRWCRAGGTTLSGCLPPFNTPLEMPKTYTKVQTVISVDAFNTPLEMRFRGVACDNQILCRTRFQYSIGDAGPAAWPQRGLLLLDLSILHWRCVCSIRRLGGHHPQKLSILHWRCGALFLRVLRLVFTSASRLSILHWRCVRRSASKMKA